MKYFKKLLFCFFLFGFSCTIHAQHKIIWDFTNADTAVQRGLYKQLNNVLTAAPDTKVEVVFHGNAIYALLKDTGYHKELIKALFKKGVVFVACNNSLKGRNIETNRVIEEAIIVPVAILEIATKQEAGWVYIKAG